MKKLMRAKTPLTNLVDISSIVQSHKVIRHITDGTNMNSAISAQTLRTLSSEILDFVPSDVTFGDWGMVTDTTGGWGNYIETLRKTVDGEYKLTGSNSDSHGEISVGGESSAIRIYGYDAWSSISLTNKEQGKMENRNIMSELHEAHTMKFFEKTDEIFYKTLWNNDFVRSDAVKEWKDQSDVERLITIYNLIKKQRIGKNKRYWGNIVALDDEMLLDVTTTDYSKYKEGSIEMKVKQTFNVNFISSWRLSGSADGKIKGLGKNGKRTAGVFQTGRQAMRNRIPVKLRISPSNKDGWGERFQGLFRVGGVDVLDLGAGEILDNL